MINDPLAALGIHRRPAPDELANAYAAADDAGRQLFFAFFVFCLEHGTRVGTNEAIDYNLRLIESLYDRVFDDQDVLVGFREFDERWSRILGGRQEP